MPEPEFALSYDCPDCRKQWTITARVRRDDACPRCGSVSLPTRTRQIDDWPHPTSRAPQRPYPYREETTPAGIQLTIPGCERTRPPTSATPFQLSMF